METPTEEIEISIESASPSWKIDPEGVYFDKETGSSEVSICSTKTFSAYKDVVVAQSATNLTGEFNTSLNKSVNKEYETILTEKRTRDLQADSEYDQIYNRSLQRQYDEIEQREQVLNQYIQQGGRETRKKKIKMSSQTRKIVK
jgi:hypothetical protein